MLRFIICCLICYALFYLFAVFFKLPCLVLYEPRVFRKKPLYIHEVWLRSVYTLPSPDVTCGNTWSMLLLLVVNPTPIFLFWCLRAFLIFRLSKRSFLYFLCFLRTRRFTGNICRSKTKLKLCWQDAVVTFYLMNCFSCMYLQIHRSWFYLVFFMSNNLCLFLISTDLTHWPCVHLKHNTSFSLSRCLMQLIYSFMFRKKSLDLDAKVSVFSSIYFII